MYEWSVQINCLKDCDTQINASTSLIQAWIYSLWHMQCYDRVGSFIAWSKSNWWFDVNWDFANPMSWVWCLWYSHHSRDTHQMKWMHNPCLKPDFDICRACSTKKCTIDMIGNAFHPMDGMNMMYWMLVIGVWSQLTKMYDPIKLAIWCEMGSSWSNCIGCHLIVFAMFVGLG